MRDDIRQAADGLRNETQKLFGVGVGIGIGINFFVHEDWVNRFQKPTLIPTPTPTPI